MSWLRRFIGYILDPFDVRKVVNHINSKATMLQSDIHHQSLKTEQLLQAFENSEQNMKDYYFLKTVNQALHAQVPDMFWVKDIYGKYLLANKALIDGLLFDENPIGKTDIDLASAEIERVGAKNHTFGQICGNSDKEVLRRELPMKFNEDGLVKGEYIMLQVHKNVVRDEADNIIGVVGVGRDITYQITALNSIISTTTCNKTKQELIDLRDYYRYDDRSTNV